MEQNLFFTLAVGAGFLLIGLVIYSYLKPKPEHRPSVTALLGLLGFALVASPNWTRISIRSEGLELSLLREMEGRQLRALTTLLDRVGTDEPAAAPEPPPVVPEEPSEVDAPPDGEEPASDGPESRRALAASGMEQLLARYRRGELDLGALSDAELLALNEQLSAPERWVGRRH